MMMVHLNFWWLILIHSTRRKRSNIFVTRLVLLYDSAANEKGEAKFARGMGIGIEREEEEARDLLLGRRHVSVSLLLSLLHDEERRTGAS